MKRFALACALLVATSAGAAAADIALWARSRTEGYVTPLVKAYNESHPDKVVLTLIPNEQFVAKIGTAIAGGTPPDLMSIDLIFVPTFARAEQLSEITKEAKALPYFGRLMGSHLRLGTFEGKLYAVPFSAEGSFLMYNKALFRRAGLDAEKPPQNWAEVRDAARRITALGEGIYGYYFPGNCAGCNVFTFLPAVWASGGDMLSEDGQTATLTDPAVKQALSYYRDLWASKLVLPAGRNDGGENWVSSPATGKVGMWPGGAFTLGALKRTAPSMDIGVTYLPGPQAGAWSSFAGGDSIAIPKGTRNAKAAWDFIQWSFSPEVQVDILARNSSVPVRTDLADNKFSQQDPRYIVAAGAMAKGRTPYSFVYNDLFNSPQGPFLRMLQRAVFDGDVDGAIAEAQARFKQIIDAGN